LIEGQPARSPRLLLPAFSLQQFKAQSVPIAIKRLGFDSLPQSLVLFEGLKARRFCSRATFNMPGCGISIVEGLTYFIFLLVCVVVRKVLITP